MILCLSDRRLPHLIHSTCLGLILTFFCQLLGLNFFSTIHPFLSALHENLH